MSGQSLLSVAGWWVAWVYALSLALPLVLGSVRNDLGLSPEEVFRRWARDLFFEENGLTVSQGETNALATLKAKATSPAPVAGTVEVVVEELTAKKGVDFEVAKRGAAVYFDKGGTEGTLRFMLDGDPDIRIIDLKTWKEKRQFRLRLQQGHDTMTPGDRGLCLVTIDDGAEPLDSGRIKVGFAKQDLAVPLKDLASTPIELTAATAVDKPVPVMFSLHRTLEGERKPLGKFERTFERGTRRMTFRLSDELEPDELERLGMIDTGAPGRDDTYELDLLPSSPLFPDGSPTCRILATNTNRPPETKLRYLDKDGRQISYLDWNGGSVELEYDRGMANASDHVLTIDGQQIGVASFAAGSTRSNPISLAGKGLEKRVGRRCGVTTQPGGGCCKGQGSCSGKVLCGEPVAGDYMLIVVNNERLHDPSDTIVAEVRRALADEKAKPYGNQAIILNPDDEDALTSGEGGPDPKKMFQPFNKEGHDVASQLKRIEEVVARKREAAANPDLRAVVVWPERDLAAKTGVRAVDGADLQPMSFLLPDADASYAGAVGRQLMPPGAGLRDFTVRAPDSRELRAHLVNVIGERDPVERDPVEDEFDE